MLIIIHVKYKPRSNFLYVLWKSRCKKAVHDQIASLCCSGPPLPCVPLMTWLLWEWTCVLWNACVLWPWYPGRQPALPHKGSASCRSWSSAVLVGSLPCVFCSGLPLGPVISWLSKKVHPAQPVVITWLPASGRFYHSLASLPEGGRGKAIKAETQTGASRYLVTVLVNDGTRGEGNWSCQVSTAIWTSSQRLRWASLFGNRKWFQTRTWSLSPEEME